MHDFRIDDKLLDEYKFLWMQNMNGLFYFGLFFITHTFAGILYPSLKSELRRKRELLVSNRFLFFQIDSHKRKMWKSESKAIFVRASTDIKEGVYYHVTLYDEQIRSHQFCRQLKFILISQSGIGCLEKCELWERDGIRKVYSCSSFVRICIQLTICRQSYIHEC